MFKAVYPVILIILFWTELGRLHGPMVGGQTDLVVSQLDLILFSRHWHVEWMAALPLPWLSEVMHLVYLLYFPAVFGTALLLMFRKSREAQRDVLLRLLVTYTGCFFIYLIFPVVGPADMTALPEIARGFFYSFSHGAQAAGDSLGTAFPSSHVAGAVTIAFAAGRWFSRPVARGYLLFAVLVALATVYTRNHYTIDAVAGALWAILLQVAVVPMLLIQRRQAVVSVPQLIPRWWAVETTGSRT
jgi:membrane-associated phospholipid phosphatase